MTKEVRSSCGCLISLIGLILLVSGYNMRMEFKENRSIMRKMELYAGDPKLIEEFKQKLKEKEDGGKSYRAMVAQRDAKLKDQQDRIDAAYALGRQIDKEREEKRKQKEKEDRERALKIQESIHYLLTFHYPDEHDLHNYVKSLDVNEERVYHSKHAIGLEIEKKFQRPDWRDTVERMEIEGSGPTCTKCGFFKSLWTIEKGGIDHHTCEPCTIRHFPELVQIVK